MRFNPLTGKISYGPAPAPGASRPAPRFDQLSSAVDYSRKQGDFDILSLFANDEKGAVYDLSDLSSLFQTTNESTPVTASGQALQRINDLSGNGNHLSRASNNPLYNVTGAIKSARFDGSNDWMSAASFDLSSSDCVTVIVGVTLKRDDTTEVIMEHGTSSIDGGWGLFNSNGLNGAAGAGIGLSGSYLFNNGTVKAPQPSVLTTVFNPAGATKDDRAALRRNFVAENETQIADSGTITTGSFASRTLFMGVRNEGSFACQMDLHSCIIINRLLTESELAKAETWVASRAGVTTAPVTPYSDTPTLFTDSGASVAGDDYVLTSPFARVEYETSATILDIESFNDGYDSFSGYTKLGVYKDGFFWRTVDIGGLGGQTNQIALPAGTKTISIVNGLQSTLGSGPPKGAFLTTVRANAPLSRQSPSAANRIVIYGDSIAVGSDASPIMQNAWALKLRTALSPRSVALEAWGFRSLHEDAVDSTARAAFVAKIVAYAPAVFWMAIGTNDYGLNKWSAASFGTAYAALLDALHTALPSLEIYCQTPLLRSDESANGYGSTMGNYRSQITTAVSSRTSFATLVDGNAIMTTGDLSDGVHPNTAGHALYATFVEALF